MKFMNLLAIAAMMAFVGTANAQIDSSTITKLDGVAQPLVKPSPTSQPVADSAYSISVGGCSLDPLTMAIDACFGFTINRVDAIMDENCDEIGVDAQEIIMAGTGEPIEAYESVECNMDGSFQLTVGTRTTSTMNSILPTGFINGMTGEPITEAGFFLGSNNFEGTDLSFDAPATVTFATVDILDINGMSLFDDGLPAELDPAVFFNDDPFDGSWMGGTGVAFGGGVDDTVWEMVCVITYTADTACTAFASSCGDGGDCMFAPGDVNEDGMVTLLDVAPFTTLLLDGGFLCQADFSGPGGVPDGVITLLDVAGLVDAILGGG